VGRRASSEDAVRFIAPFILIGALATSGLSFANDINLEKQTPEQLKSACNQAGGKFSQDSHGYGCGTNCTGGPGTACTVSCEPDKKCVAQVMGSHRPRHILDALKKPAGRR
jgi:L-aminopeptidase/D-esterase-like protein